MLSSLDKRPSMCHEMLHHDCNTFKTRPDMECFAKVVKQLLNIFKNCSIIDVLNTPQDMPTDQKLIW